MRGDFYRCPLYGDNKRSLSQGYAYRIGPVLTHVEGLGLHLHIHEKMPFVDMLLEAFIVSMRISNDQRAR